MCRNITTLRGLQPAATTEEIEAASRQFVRKVTGARQAPKGADAQYEAAISEIARITEALLRDLPPRRQPPATIPPLRRLGAAAIEHRHDHVGEHEHPHDHGDHTHVHDPAPTTATSA